MNTDLTLMRKFVSPEIIFGRGSRHLAGSYIRNLGIEKALLVSDPGVIAAGWVEDVETSLKEAGVEYQIYSEVSPNPRSQEVMKGAEIYRDAGCEGIIAVGGGSPMDCAKGIGIVHTHKKNILAFEGVDLITRAVPPLVFIPTTAGTSSDVSQFTIIGNEEERVKIAIVSKAIVPDVSLIDPETTHSMDPYLTACTGIDALVHAVEAFVSTAHSPMTDMHALEAIRTLYQYLPLLHQTPENNDYRDKVMQASMFAGLAFSNAILGAVHAMAHSLGGFLDLPHGECNAILLDRVVDFNFDASKERYEQIARAMNIDFKNSNQKQRKEQLVKSIQDLKHTMGINKTLSELGVSLSDIPILSSKAVKDACLITNPREANQRDIEVIYEEAF
jgi:alcohol dehydrogenase